jgi:hypothetical protein
LWFLTTDAGTPRDLIADIWKCITRLQGACRLGDIIHVRRVRDPDGLFRYLAKEQTPQAGYRREHNPVRGGCARTNP